MEKINLGAVIGIMETIGFVKIRYNIDEVAQMLRERGYKVRIEDDFIFLED
ncbi:hypothetical protein [Cetobacterium sp.]|uniref:hypothetical protein n=1 Tax=Cetobacterium sp. TaxID=2071632 RepID=UPI003F3771B4